MRGFKSWLIVLILKMNNSTHEWKPTKKLHARNIIVSIYYIQSNMNFIS